MEQPLRLTYAAAGGGRRWSKLTIVAFVTAFLSPKIADAVTWATGSIAGVPGSTFLPLTAACFAASVLFCVWAALRAARKGIRGLWLALAGVPAACFWARVYLS